MKLANRMKAKGVFFDLYGTLLILGDMRQAWSDWLDALYAGLCRRGAELTRPEFEDRCHQFFGKQEPPAADGLTVFERRIRRLASGLGLAVDARELKVMATQACNAWQQHVRTDPEALEVLAALKLSKTLALISNFDHPPHAYQVLREAGLDGFFQTIVVSGEVGIKKPDPGIFRLALERTGLRPEAVVYVGDTREDIKGATAAGIRPILIARPEGPNQPGILDYTRRDEQPLDRIVSNCPFSAVTIRSLREVDGIVDGRHGSWRR